VARHFGGEKALLVPQGVTEVLVELDALPEVPAAGDELTVVAAAVAGAESLVPVEVGTVLLVYARM